MVTRRLKFALVSLAVMTLVNSGLTHAQKLSDKEQKIYQEMKSKPLPGEFHKMEIESKWSATEDQYRGMLGEFKQGNQFMGHEINIRWDGMPKVFIDVYYDTPDGALAKKGQILRFRKRVTLPLAKNLPKGYLPKNYQFKGKGKDIQKLVGSTARGLWIPEWGRVQFKEAPELRGAVWFRNEVGDTIIWDNPKYDPKINDNSSEVAENIIKGRTKHEAIDQLLLHHDRAVLAQLQPVSQVTDIRYRVEFLEGKRPAYEVSIDRLETAHLSGPKKGTYEVGFEGELEILPVEST